MKSKKMIKIWSVLCVTILLSKGVSSKEKEEVFKKRKKVFQIEESVIRKPLKLRDPFKKKRIRSQKKQSTYKTILVDNSYSNLPSIGNTPIKSIKIVGILFGEKRVAMAQVGSGKEVYILREGMKIGADKAEIKAILPGGIVVVEKMRNIYEQDEYIETVIPFSGGI